MDTCSHDWEKYFQSSSTIVVLRCTQCKIASIFEVIPAESKKAS